MKQKISFGIFGVVLCSLISGAWGDAPLLGENGMVLFEQTLTRESSVESFVDGRFIDKSDRVWGTQLFLWKGGLLKDRWGDSELLLTYSVLNLSYDEYSQNDYFYHNPEVRWETRHFSEYPIQFRLGFEATSLDGDDLYDSLDFTFRVQDRDDSSFLDELTYKLIFLDYDAQFGNGRDGTEHEIEVEKSLTGMHAQVGLMVIVEAGLRTTDVDGYGYKSFGLSLDGAIFNLPKPWESNFDVKFRIRDYEDTYPGYTKGRNDKRYSLGGDLSRTIYKDVVSIGLDVLIEKNASNISDFDFDNTSIGFNVSLLWV